MNILNKVGSKTRASAAALSVAAALATGGAAAQNAAADALYQQLGGQPGLTLLVDDLMPRLLADLRMNPFFKDVDQKQFKEQLVAQFCDVSGGPCKYQGAEMKKAHSGVDITRADFNALVEVLQQSMDARGIPFTAQNRLLAKLAPMHRVIINSPER